MKVLIKNGRALDPASKFDEVSDILIEDGKIVKIGKAIKEQADQTLSLIHI